MAIRATLNPALQGADPQILRDIKRAASAADVDFGYLVAQASQESAFRPDAKAATSSATGLYQFTEGTWLRMFQQHGAQYGYGQLAQAITLDDAGRAHVADAGFRRQILGLRKDPALSAAMAAELAKENRAELERGLGRSVNHTELYLAHFLGAGGACKFLGRAACNRNASAADLLPAAASANPTVFFDGSGRARSVGEIYQHFAAKIEGQAASSLAALPDGGPNAATLASLALSPASGATRPLALGSLGLFGVPNERTTLSQHALDQLALAALHITSPDGRRHEPDGAGTAQPNALAAARPHKGAGSV